MFFFKKQKLLEILQCYKTKTRYKSWMTLINTKESELVATESTSGKNYWVNNSH